VFLYHPQSRTMILIC
ncbi:hypothetical protein ACTFIW_009121, partial [Dictyostelium discoideum]